MSGRRRLEQRADSSGDLRDRAQSRNSLILRRKSRATRVGTQFEKRLSKVAARGGGRNRNSNAAVWGGTLRAPRAAAFFVPLQQ
jgi:hypothetical protein